MRKGASLSTDQNIRQPFPASQTGGNLGSAGADDAQAQIVCPNCGGGFSNDEARCPYCGELNPYGAEKAYMEELADIKEDTEDLLDDAQDDLKTSLKSNTKRTLTVVVIVLAVLASLFAITTCMDKHDQQRELRDFQAREAFRAQYFEEFDRLYEAGDDDALSAYVWSLLDDPGFDAFFTWQHIGVLEAHDDWEALRAVSEEIDKGTCNIDDYTWSVSTAMRLARLDDSSNHPSTLLSPEEEERIAKYRAYAWQFLENTLQMSESEITAFADDAKDANGNLQRDKLQHNLEARLKQLGTLR